MTYEDKSGSRTGRGVLAAVGNPDHVEAVLAVAAAWARAIDAEVVALTVVRVPPGLRLAEGRGMTDRATPVIDRIHEFADATDDVRVSIVVAAGRSISGVIDNIADREGAGVVVLGWKGTVHPDTVRGSIAQQVLLTSSVLTLVVKDTGFPEPPRVVIAAISPGLRGSETLATSATLARGLGVDLHLATVVAEDGDHDELAAWLDEVRDGLLDETDLAADRIHVDLRRGGDVVGELADAAGDDGILVVGSSRDWVLRENLFGAFTDELANRARSPVVMVHRPESTPVMPGARSPGRYVAAGTSAPVMPGPRPEPTARAVAVEAVGPAGGGRVGGRATVAYAPSYLVKPFTRWRQRSIATISMGVGTGRRHRRRDPAGTGLGTATRDCGAPRPRLGWTTSGPSPAR